MLVDTNGGALMVSRGASRRASPARPGLCTAGAWQGRARRLAGRALVALQRRCQALPDAARRCSRDATATLHGRGESGVPRSMPRVVVLLDGTESDGQAGQKGRARQGQGGAR